MGRLTSTAQIELRGLRLLVRLLRGEEPAPKEALVANWIKEADAALDAAGYVRWAPATEAVGVEGGGQQAKQVGEVLTLCYYLEELGDVQVRLGGRVFVSYVREDATTVDDLAVDLQCCGVEVWLDRQDLAESAGVEWPTAIRQAIAGGTHFICCFSEAWMKRDSTYADEEVAVALEQFDQRETSERWFLPIELAPNTVPDVRTGAGQSIRDFQAVAMYTDWFAGVLAIADAIVPPSSHDLALRRALLEGRPDERKDVIRSMYDSGDHRHAIPLMSYVQRQFAAMDRSSSLRENQGGMAMYEAIRALGRFGRESPYVAERVLPIFIEMERRGIWSYKVIEVLSALDNQRARELLEIHDTYGDVCLSLVLDRDDVLSVDYDNLRRVADEYGGSLRQLGLAGGDND